MCVRVFVCLCSIFFFFPIAALQCLQRFVEVSLRDGAVVSAVERRSAIVMQKASLAVHSSGQRGASKTHSSPLPSFLFSLISEVMRVFCLIFICSRIYLE